MTEESAIENCLTRLAIPRSGVLQVHSSFRGLSRKGWDPGRTSEALCRYLAQGTLLMPTMSWRTVTAKQPVFDVRTTPSHTGALTEAFRVQNATHRSLHPTHSVAGVGPLAANLLSGHDIDGTPCGRHSPYGHIFDGEAGDDVFVLLIDVGFECCTAIHHPEEIVAPDVYLVEPEKSETYRLIDFDKTESTMVLRRHARRVRDLVQYGYILSRMNALRSEDIDGVGFIAVNMRTLMDAVLSRLRENPMAHFPRAAYEMGIPQSAPIEQEQKKP